jgi:hypothetical protein
MKNVLPWRVGLALPLAALLLAAAGEFTMTKKQKR